MQSMQTMNKWYVDDDHDIERVLWRNKETQAENKLKFNQIEMRRLLIDKTAILFLTRSFEELNILREITNWWDKEIINLLLLRLVFAAWVELGTRGAVEK